MLRIIMLSAIIRARTTFCCFLVMSKYVEVGLCNVVKGWAGSCVIIIEKLRKRAYKSQMIPVGLMVDCTCAIIAVLLSANIALRGRQVTRRRAGQQSTPFNSANRSLGSIFWPFHARPLTPLLPFTPLSLVVKLR